MTKSDESPTRLRRLLESANPYTWVALAFLTVGLTYYFMIPYQVDKPMLFLGQALMVMKPTLFPTIAGIGLVVTSIFAVIQSLINPQDNPFKGMNRAVLKQIGVVLVALYTFAVMFEPVGFLISAVLVTAALSYYLGNRNPLTLALLSLGIPGAVYILFTKVLLISLPEGLLY